MPLVSIIIPLHNRADELPMTLKSVLAQTEHDWEAIIVDDHSTDDAPIRAKEFADLDVRFKRVSLPDPKRGAPAARNYGFSLARGEFVLFLDSDDLLSPDCLKGRIAYLRTHPGLDFVVARCQLFRNEQGDMPLLWNADTGEPDLDRFLRMDVPWGTTGPLWARASLAAAKLEWDEEVLSGQDWEFHLRAVASGMKYNRIDAIDCHWRVATGDRDSIGKSSFGIDHARARPAVIRKMHDFIRGRGLMTEARRDAFTALYLGAAERVADRVSRREGRDVWREAYGLDLMGTRRFRQVDRYLTAKRWPWLAERLRQRIEREWPDNLLPKKARCFNVAPADPERPPTISVVMSVYNTAAFVRAAIDSILTQTFRDFEFIIIDDGSTDGGGPLLRRLADSDCRIRLVSRENKGLTASLNEGLALSRGEFVARMDGDDIAHPERFQRQLAYMRKNPECVALGAQVELIDPFDAPIDHPRHFLTHDEIDAELMAGVGWAIVHPVTMFRRDAVERVGRYRTKCNACEDLDLYLRLAEIGRLANLPDTLLKYRQHLASINHTKFDLQRKLTLEVLADAAERRGIPMPQYIPPKRNLRSRDQQYLFWGWKALKSGHPSAAVQHATQALRAKPFSIQAWKLLRCGLRGH